MSNWKSLLVGSLSCLVLFSGCSNIPDGPRTVPAQGVVTLDGAPVEGAAVVFIGKSGDYSAEGLSDIDGNFSLDTFDYKTGAVPGDYYALVTKTREITAAAGDIAGAGEAGEHAAEGGGTVQLGVEHALPEQYALVNEKFAFTVPEDGVKDLKIELTSKK